jgi:hypothetical protein
MSLDLFVNLAGFSAYIGTMGWSLWLGRWSSEPEAHLARFRRAARLPWWSIGISAILMIYATICEDVVTAAIWTINALVAVYFIRTTRRASVEQHRRVHTARKANIAMEKLHHGQPFRRS